MRIDVVVYEGFDELDAVAPFEVLANVPDLDVRFVHLEGARTVRAAHGLLVEAAGGLSERPDVVVVPGGGWNDRRPAGARTEAERGALPAALAERHAAGAVLASVCTGAMLLAAAGLLDGRPATTHHGALEDLRAAGAVLKRARVVDAGDVVTAGGVTSGLDLALWLVERFAGPPVAAAVEAGMEYERRGTVWRERA